MTVWVRPLGNARHDVRVKVNLTHGNQMNAADIAVVEVRPSPHVIAGRLSSGDQRAVFEWISVIPRRLSNIGKAGLTPSGSGRC